MQIYDSKCPIGKNIHLHQILIEVYPFYLNVLHFVSFLYDLVLILEVYVVYS